eukprot:521116_1
MFRHAVQRAKYLKFNSFAPTLVQFQRFKYNQSNSNSGSNNNSKYYIGGGTATGTALGLSFFSKSKKKKESNKPNKNRDTNKVYALDEVRKHCTADSVWVTLRGDVYDVTSFLTGHPGLKSRLLMAAGQDLSIFWEVYTDHYRGHVIPWMSRFKIGKLSDSDRHTAENPEYKFANAYDDDPVRHPDLLHNTYHPFNGEPLLERLVDPNYTIDNYYTKNHMHYTRNHLPVPRIDVEDYEFEVTAGNGIKKSKIYTLNDLKTKFKKYTVVSTLQCAGNRREDFHGLPRRDGKGDNLIFIGPHWVVGAISCAKWAGCRLRDVLADCGLDVDGLALGNVKHGEGTGVGSHFHFTGTDTDETGLEYGVSIPIDKGVDGLGDTLIAYEMNDLPLPRDHGFPCRALVPGFAGARNCKWIKEVSLEYKTSMKPWHENAYRGFSPDISFEEDLYLWEKAPLVNLRHEKGKGMQPNIAPIALEQPIQSITCFPPPNSTIGGKNIDHILVKGVAWSGGGRNVHRVDVSIDGGDSFVGSELYKPADLRERENRMRQWGWYHFSAKVPIPENIQQKLRSGKQHSFEITSKGVSGDYNVQPECPEPVYNARGIQVNHWYVVPVTCDPKLRDGKVIRNHQQDKRDKFRNKPTGGKFWIPWEAPGTPRRVNQSEIEQTFDEHYYNYAHVK